MSISRYQNKNQTQTQNPVVKARDLLGVPFSIMSFKVMTMHSDQYGDSETALSTVNVNGIDYTCFFRQKAILETFKAMEADPELVLPVRDVTVSEYCNKKGQKYLTLDDWVE